MKERTVSWINEHKKVWRAAALIVLAVAMMGPWGFDLIDVPSEYSCAPNIRLDGDLCGMPLSWIEAFCSMVEGLVYASAGLATGAVGFIEWTRGFLYSLPLFLLVLPFFSTLLLILRGDRRRRQVFNIVAWGLAAGIILLIELFRVAWGLTIGISLLIYLKLFWALWGVRLYVGLAAGVLAIELLAIRSNRG